MKQESQSIYTLEHEMFRRTVAQFIKKEVDPNLEKWETQHHPDREFWKKAGAAGLLAPGMPEEYGGAGGDFLHHIIVTQEKGKSLAAINSGVLFSSDLPTFHILKFGTEEQKAYWLPRVIRGESILTVAMSEPHSGSDVAAIRTHAKLEGDAYVINGSKIYISGGTIADVAIVATKTDPDAGAKGVSLFLMDLNQPGVRRGNPLHKMGQNGGDNCELFFDGVRVPATSMLGEKGRGFGVLMSEMPRERLLISVQALEEAQLAFDLTVGFVKQRVAFGQKVMDFQNTQFQLATLKADLTVGRAYIDDCIEEAVTGSLDNTRSAIAKLWITEMQGRVVDQCVQLHGGAGYMSEYPISKLYTAARVTRIFGGTSEIMRLSIARTI